MAWSEKISHLDLLGTALLSAVLLSSLSAIQMLSVDDPPKSVVIILFMVSGVAAATLVLQQKLRKGETLIPKRLLLGQRNVWAAAGLLAFLMACLANHVYFLPFFLQVRPSFQ